MFLYAFGLPAYSTDSFFMQRRKLIGVCLWNDDLRRSKNIEFGVVGRGNRIVVVTQASGRKRHLQWTRFRYRQISVGCRHIGLCIYGLCRLLCIFYSTLISGDFSSWFNHCLTTETTMFYIKRCLQYTDFLATCRSETFSLSRCTCWCNCLHFLALQ